MTSFFQKHCRCLTSLLSTLDIDIDLSRSWIQRHLGLFYTTNFGRVECVMIYVWVSCAVDSINKVTEEFNTYDIPPSCIRSYYIVSGVN
jgi:hypothetical protein